MMMNTFYYDCDIILSFGWVKGDGTKLLLMLLPVVGDNICINLAIYCTFLNLNLYQPTHDEQIFSDSKSSKPVAWHSFSKSNLFY